MAVRLKPFPVPRRSKARRNPTEWEDVVKQWDQYMACARVGDKDGEFYHPEGKAFNARALSKCGGTKKGEIDCSPTGKGCNDKWKQFESTLTLFNRTSEYSIDAMVSDFTYGVSPKSVLAKLQAATTADLQELDDSTAAGEEDLLPVLDSSPDSADPDAALVDATASYVPPPEEGTSMTPFIIGGAVLLAGAGAFLFLRKGKKKKKSSGE